MIEKAIGIFIVGCLVFLWHFIADYVKKTPLRKFTHSVTGCIVGLIVCLTTYLLLAPSNMRPREIEELKTIFCMFMCVFAVIGIIGDGFGAILFWSIFAVVFIGIIACGGGLMLFSVASTLGIIGLFMYILGNAAEATVKGIGREVGEATSEVLQGVGVSKDTSDAIGSVAGGLAAGAMVKGAVDTVHSTYSDAVNSTSYANNSTNYVPDGNPDLVHVDGYYRQDGTYVHSHVRTSPNNNVGDNISAHK